MQSNTVALDVNFRIWILMITVILFSSITACSDSPEALAEKIRTTRKVAEFQNCCEKLTDQTVIGNIVLTGDFWGRRRTALDYITDKGVLSEIIAKSEDADIQMFAAQRLSAIEKGAGLDEVMVINWTYVDKTGKAAPASEVSKARWEQCLASIGKKSDFNSIPGSPRLPE